MTTLLTLLSNELEARKGETHATFGSVNMSYDDMYSSSFRSEAILLCDHLNKCTNSMEEYYTEFNEIESELAGGVKSALFLKATGVDLESIECEHEYEARLNQLDDWCGEWEVKNKRTFESLITETTEVCFLCNYKGEGEGVVVVSELVKHLPIFVSKYNYK